jgi:hypothetical protein
LKWFDICRVYYCNDVHNTYTSKSIPSILRHICIITYLSFLSQT